MNREDKLLFAVGISFLFLILLVWWNRASISACAMGSHPGYLEKLEEIKVGMSKKEVIDILGKPAKIITYPEHNHSCLKYYYGDFFWGKEDVVYSFYVDENGKVYLINFEH